MKKLQLFLVFLILSLPILSQDKLISIDKSGKLFKVDKTLEKKIKIFAEYSSFSEASLYQTTDSLFYVEVQTGSGNNVMKHKKTLTLAEKDAFISTVSERVDKYAPNSRIDQSGKTLLLSVNTFMGLYYYGPVTSLLLDGDSPESLPASALVAGGVGFLLPYLLTNNKEITEAQAYSSFYFQSRGVAYGWALPYLFVNAESGYPGAAVSLVTSSVVVKASSPVNCMKSVSNSFIKQPLVWCCKDSKLVSFSKQYPSP